MLSSRDYQVARSAASQIAGITFWFLLWLMNGYFTVVALTAFGNMLAEPADEYPVWLGGAIVAVGGLLSNAGIAWVLHIIGSLVEGASWQNLRQRAGLTFLLILILDIWTTTIGLSAIAETWGYTIGTLQIVLITGSAVIIALLPEAMIVGHLKNLDVIED